MLENNQAFPSFVNTISTGSYTGNCGWTTDEINDGGNLIKKYKYCKNAKDVMCGALHCHYDGQPSTENFRLLSLDLGIVSTTVEGHTCHVASFDVGKYRNAVLCLDQGILVIIPWFRYFKIVRLSTLLE